MRVESRRARDIDHVSNSDCVLCESCAPAMRGVCAEGQAEVVGLGANVMRRGGPARRDSCV